MLSRLATMKERRPKVINRRGRANSGSEVFGRTRPVEGIIALYNNLVLFLNFIYLYKLLNTNIYNKE